MKVSEDIRRDNTYWVNRRNKWRERYAVICNEIKNAKSCIRMYHSCGEHDIANVYVTRFIALKILANEMMIDRCLITEMLKETSYRYV